MAQNKVTYQRDTEAFKSRKSFEERESRKQMKHHKPRHYELDVEDEVEVEVEETERFYDLDE